MTAAAQTHPAARATHAIYEAAMLAAGLCTPGDDGGSVAEDGEAINTLLEHAAEDVAATYQAYDEVLANNARLLALNIQLESDLRSVRNQGVADAREITRLTQANDALNERLRALNDRLAVASRDVEQLLQRASIRLQGETTDFNGIRGLRDVLDPSTVVDDHGDFVILNTRRTAAGA